MARSIIVSPEDAPAQDQQDREELHEPLRGAELTPLLCSLTSESLWKVSIFHRSLYQSILSRASRREVTGKSVMSFQSILFVLAACPAPEHE